jgi:predicted alpha/beta superfamily hydrolase
MGERWQALVGFSALLWGLIPAVGWTQQTDLGQTVVLRSEILDELRTIYVSLPASYHQSRRSYPVLYLLDANWHFAVVASQVRYLSECQASDIIAPELIVVGIENTDRDRDFTPTHVPEYKGMKFPTSGGAPEFLEFMTRELIPLIDSTYRTVDHRVLAGWSFGGLFAYYAMLEDPTVFNAYIGISPSVWWEDEALLDRQGRGTADLPRRLVMTIGSDEAGGMNHEAVTRLAEQLEANPVDGLAVSLMTIDGAGHNQSLPPAYYRAIRHLYSDWLAPDDVIETGRDRVEQYYRDLSALYGYAVPIPEQVMIRLALENLDEANFEQARSTMAEVTKLYPESSMARYLLGRVQHKEGALEAARGDYLAAIDLELRQEPPDGLSLRHYRSRLAELVDEEAAAAAADEHGGS